MKKKRKQLLMVAAGSLLLAGALTAQYMNNGSNVTPTQAEGVSYGSTWDFIAEIGPTAQTIASEYDLYASVMIAQAILESSSGNSTLSQAPYYNYFGIKGAYNGNSVSLATWEDDGAGNSYTINAAFRSYSSPADSLYDYAALLSSSYYAGTHKSNTTSYADATAALTGTYATDTSYGDKLNSIIESYGLTQYDSVAYDSGASTSTADSVWNSYRGSYTSSETLALDEAWASRFQ